MDNADTNPLCSRISASSLGVLCLLIGQLWASGLKAQTPDEHASHHPGGAATAVGVMPVAGGATQAPGGMGGMMEGMGEMMKGMMGGAKTQELYPSLMALPELSPEQRKQVEAQAGERMHAGTVLMGQALDTLNAGTQSGDYAAMHDAATRLREGIAQLESGIAARRALADGRAPREVALAWFKQEMNLSLGALPAAHQPFGGMGFHLIVIALLAAFAVAMIAMYFFKMRRAHELLAGLADGGPVTPPAAAAAEKPVAAEVKPVVAPVAAAAPAVVPSEKWSGKLRIGKIFEETHNVKTFRLMDPLGGELPFTFQPGQYLTVTVLPEGKPVRRSYTIASSPTEHGYVDLTIKREDKGIESRYLHDRVQEGDILDFLGPSGSFVFTGHECKCLVFIAAGVGITPLMSVTRYLTDKSWPGEIFLLCSCHSPADFIFREELEFLQRRHPNLHVVATVTSAEGTEWKGPTGRITKELISQSVPDITSRRVHICGPKEMMQATEKFLAELGVPKEQIKTEAFGPAIGKPEAEAKPPATAAEKPAAEAAPPAIAKSPPAAGAVAPTAVSVTFKKSGKSAPLPPDKSILEAAEDIGVNIPFECRVGTCGECKIMKLSGTVTMEVEDALSADEKASGMILACQAKARGEVVVDV